MVEPKLVHVAHVTIADGLASILGCRVFSLPIKYLGLPLEDSFKVKSI
jgi:hypothetical protein